MKMCIEIRERACTLFAVNVTASWNNILFNAKRAPEFPERVTVFLDMIKEQLPDRLLLSRGMEFDINIIPDTQPLVQAFITISPRQLQEFKSQVQTYLAKRLLRPYGAPV